MFVIRPGTSGTLCINFTGTSGRSQNYSANDFAVQAQIVDATKNPGGYTYSYKTAPNISFTLDSVPQIPVDGPFNVTAVYQVDAAPGITGYYTISYPNNCPPFTPLAVVSSSGSITLADFPGFFMPSTCLDIAPFDRVSITGFGGGMSAILVTA